MRVRAKKLDDALYQIIFHYSLHPLGLKSKFIVHAGPVRRAAQIDRFQRVTFAIDFEHKIAQVIISDDRTKRPLNTDVGIVDIVEYFSSKRPVRIADDTAQSQVR